jgi:hypothetical protein
MDEYVWVREVREVQAAGVSAGAEKGGTGVRERTRDMILIDIDYCEKRLDGLMRGRMVGRPSDEGLEQALEDYRQELEALKQKQA